MTPRRLIRLWLFLAISFGATTSFSLAADNPALGIGEPNTPFDEPEPECECEGVDCDPCRGSGSPVMLHDGELFQSFTDLSFGLRTIPYTHSRTYFSDDFYVGFFGRGFHSSLDMMSIATYRGGLQNEVVVIRWPDGQRSTFTKQPDGSFSQSLGRFETLTEIPGGFELRTPDQILYTFDADTKLLSIADRNDNNVSFAYDAQDRPATITLPGNRDITIGYNARGFVDTVSDFAGRSVSYTYDLDDMLISFIDARSNTWRYEYDDGRLARVINPEIQTQLSATYDTEGRISTIVDADGDYTYTYPSATQTVKTDNETGGAWTYIYDAQGVITEIRDPLNGRTRYTYDSMYNQTQIIDANSKTTTFAYDDAGRLLTKTDPLTNVTSYTYDAFGRLQTITNARNVITRFEYDPTGNRTQIIEASGDPLQRLTRMTYDAAGNRITRTDPMNNTTTFDYDAMGNLTRVTDALTNETDFEYDSLGNITKIIDAISEETTFTYNELNQPTSVTDPLSYTQSFTYDAAGRPATMVDREANVTAFSFDKVSRLIGLTDPMTLNVTYEYDAAGRLLRFVDANGKETTTTYDLAGRADTVTNALLQTSIFGYDAVGNTTSITDANTNTTTYTVDALGRVTRTTFPDTTFETTTYGPTGLVDQKTDRATRTTTFTHDSLARLTNKTYPDASTATFSYNALDHQLTAINAAAIFTFSYDVLGRLRTEINALRGQIVTSTYDARGQRETMTDPASRTATYTYDATANMTQISTVAFGAVNYTYDRNGRRTGRTNPNATTSAYTYNDAGYLTDIVHLQSDNSGLLNFNFTVDGLGNPLTMTDNLGLHQFTYDDVYQMIGATHPNTGVNPVESYTYDSVGNRLTSHLSASYTYDSDNRMLDDDDFTYTYDPNGNLMTKTAKVGGDLTQYGYDFDNHLVRVDHPDSSATTYLYDALGRRIEENADGTITRFTYDGNALIGEYNSVGVQIAAILHGPGVDEPVVMIRGGQEYVFHDAGVRSIVALTDTSENIAASYIYDSFGRIVQETGSVANRFRYTAREWNASSQTYDYRARTYLPGVGRFAQLDPLGLDGDEHPYVYVANNPVSGRDPYGSSRCTDRCHEDYRGKVDRARRNAHLGNAACATGFALCMVAAALGTAASAAPLCFAALVVCEAWVVTTFELALSDASEDLSTCLRRCEEDEECPPPGPNA